MKRHKVGVSFRDPSLAENVTSSDPVPSGDVTDHDPKVDDTTLSQNVTKKTLSSLRSALYLISYHFRA